MDIKIVEMLRENIIEIILNDMDKNSDNVDILKNNIIDVFFVE
jgi:hypothetical protein